MGPFCSKKGVQNSISKTSNSVTRPSLLPAASKSAAVRSSQSPLKGDSGGDNSGMSRILLQNFPRSQEERETQADHRPLLQSFCSHTDIQNGDTEKNERRRSAKRLGIFIGSNRCLFAYPDTSSVSQIPQIHVQRSCVPVQGTPIRPLDKSLRVYTPYECHCDIPKEKGDNSTSLSRRLVSSKPKPSKTVGTQTIHFVADQLTRSDHQLRKIDLVPAQVFTFIGMEFLTHINIFRVPQNRQMKILETVRMFSQKTSVSARDFLSLLGQLNAAADLVMLGRLHLRPLQISLHNQWRPQNLPYFHQIVMTTEILQHLK